MNYSDIKNIADKLQANLSKVLVGKEDTCTLLLTTLFAGGNLLMEDAPGTGKTLLAKTLSKSISAKFSRIQFTPDLLPSDITGINYYNPKSGEFIFNKGPVFSNIVLADEINRATPRTQSSLLECMEEKQVTIDGVTHKLEAPFFVIATQNPIETAGTFPLPEAQLDRFMMKINVGFPDEEEELAIIDRFNGANPYETIQSVCTPQELNEVFSLISQAYISPELKEYIVRIIRLTRQIEGTELGVSPRGTLAFIRALSAYAAIKGRDYVIPEDVKYLAPYVLAHRIVTTQSYNSRNNALNIVFDILDSVPVPTEDFTK